MRTETEAYAAANSGEVIDPRYVMALSFDLPGNARHNLLIYSNAFDNATGWTNVNLTLTGAADTAPDGTTTAYTAEDNSAGFEYLYQEIALPDPTKTYTASIFIKKDAVTKSTRNLSFRLTFQGSTPQEYHEIKLDTSNGDYLVTGSAGDRVGAVESYNADWWRISIAAAAINQAHDTIRVTFWPAIGADFVNDAAETGTVTIWGAQLNQAPSASKYIGTTTEPATQNFCWITSHDDALTPPGTPASDEIAGALMTISGQSQRISPDKAQHTIGAVTFTVLDIAGELTTKINSKLTAGDGLRNRKVILYKGDAALTDWNDYTTRLTYLVENVSYNDGVYTIETNDIQRTEKTNIFEPDQGVLTSTITSTATEIPITTADGANKFQLLAHDSNYASNPSDDVGYIKIDDEVICHDGWTDGTYTALNVVERGALNTRAGAHAVTATEASQKKKIDEYIYLEMPAPKLIYALLTGNLEGQSGKVLPDKWHLGISADFVRLEDFTGIGVDLWDTSSDKGRIARFIGAESKPGKTFIEKELLLWLGCFMPVYSDGALGLKKMAPALPYSAYDAALGTYQIVSYAALKYDQKAVINNIAIYWNWIDNLDRFTKISQLIDSNSISKHGRADLKKYEFKGVFTGVHSDGDLINYFQDITDRYSNPPLRLSITVLPEWDRLEVGDTVRVTLPPAADYHIDETLDRVFEIQQIKTDWLSGLVTLELFGGIDRAGIDSISASDVLQNSFYTAAGTELSTVLTIAGGSVTASGSLTGAASNASAIFYYDGDLTINAGVTVTISRNVQLRVKGFLTINGDIVQVGNASDTGLYGKSMSGYSVDGIPQTRGQDLVVYAVNLHKYKNSENVIGLNSLPVFNLLNPDGLSIQGAPTNLQGVDGATGARARMRPSSYANGGAGGIGGGGLLVICRGAAFGVSAGITLDGTDGATGSSVAGPISTSVYGQTGGGGAPGTVLFLIDGVYSAPTFSAAIVSALRGESNPPAGVDGYSYRQNLPSRIYSGEQGYGELIVDTFNYWESNAKVQYIPAPIAPFDWFPADEAAEVTGYENKPPDWSVIVDDGGKPVDNATDDTAANAAAALALDAIANASTAQATADGKIVSFYQDNQPSAGAWGDFWIDTNDANRLYTFVATGGDANNDIVSPEDMSTGDWTLTGSMTRTPASTFAPDGTITATYLGDTDAGALLSKIAQSLTIASSADPWNFSVYLKNDTAADSVLAVYLTGGTSLTAELNYNWSTGALTDIGGDASDLAVQQLLDGWVRISGAITNNASGNTSLSFELWPAGKGTGDTGGAWAWGAQVTLFATLYPYGQWIDSQDGEISDAITAAATAQGTADGKVTTFYASTAPTADAEGDLWYDTDDAKIYRWSDTGSVWQEVSSQQLADIIGTGNLAALDTVDTAQIDDNAVTQQFLSTTGAGGSFSSTATSTTPDTRNLATLTIPTTVSGSDITVTFSLNMNTTTLGGTAAISNRYRALKINWDTSSAVIYATNKGSIVMPDGNVTTQGAYAFTGSKTFSGDGTSMTFIVQASNGCLIGGATSIWAASFGDCLFTATEVLK